MRDEDIIDPSNPERTPWSEEKLIRAKPCLRLDLPKVCSDGGVAGLSHRFLRLLLDLISHR